MIRFTYLKISIWSVLIFSCISSACCRNASKPVLDQAMMQLIPFIDEIVIDGDPSDWADSYPSLRIMSDIKGDMPDSSDLNVRFRLGWNPEGLYILAEIWDDVIYEDPNRFWNGDGIELFISPGKGSFDIVQISVRPSYDLPDSTAAVVHYDHRRSDSLRSMIPSAYFCSQKYPGRYLLEGMVPLDVIGINSPESGVDMGVQLYINDSDMENDSTNYSLPWYPARESYRNPYAFHSVQFSESGYLENCPEIRAWIVDDKTLHLKVISEQACKGRDLGIQSDNYYSKFNLQADKNGLYSREWGFPVKKFQHGNGEIYFLNHDSLYANINMSMVHRLYEFIPEPNRFEDEIRIFELIDHFEPQTEKSILFTGSSTIRKWGSIGDDLPGLNIINRGFGGSSMKDLNHYSERIVFPYKPSSIFVYEGDNDIAGGTSPEEFIDDCIKFIRACDQHLPETEIYFMSIKPSPARWQNWKEMQKANNMLAELVGQYENVHFIDISRILLNENGSPKKNIFETDRLHLNKKGYELLSEVLSLVLYE